MCSLCVCREREWCVWGVLDGQWAGWVRLGWQVLAASHGCAVAARLYLAGADFLARLRCVATLCSRGLQQPMWLLVHKGD